MDNITFETLPAAVKALMNQVSELKELITADAPAPETKDDILNVKEAAEFLGYAVPTIYLKVHRRELPHMKRGNRLWFSKKDLTEFIKTGRRKTTDEIQTDAENYLNNNR